MQDQSIREPPCSLEAAEQQLLWLLLRPARCGPWHTHELALQVGDAEQTSVALAGLHASGLAHVNGFAHATSAAVRFHDLTVPFDGDDQAFH
jgi:hypothetical protein